MKLICSFYKLKFTRSCMVVSETCQPNYFFIVFALWLSSSARHGIASVHNWRITDDFFSYENRQVILEYPNVDVNELETSCFLETATPNKWMCNISHQLVI